MVRSRFLAHAFVLNPTPSCFHDRQGNCGVKGVCIEPRLMVTGWWVQVSCILLRSMSATRRLSNLIPSNKPWRASQSRRRGWHLMAGGTLLLWGRRADPSELCVSSLFFSGCQGRRSSIAQPERDQQAYSIPHPLLRPFARVC